MRVILTVVLSLFFFAAVAQNIGIGTTTPGFPLNFASTLGDKISLYGNTGSHYGFGIQSGLLQIHSNAAAANIAFGFGSSGAFTERVRIINSGTDGMTLNGRLHIKNGSVPLDADQTGGVWLYRADNTNLLGFMGTQNNQNIGFYGGPVNGGWGFTYNGINSRVGIGTSNPTSSLNVNGQITVDRKNFGGYGGLLLKGNVPGSNYPNIAFTVKNNAANAADVVAAMIQGDLVNSAAGAETIDLTFLTSNTGLGGLSERLRIKNNGNVGIGNANPNAPLSFPPSLGKKITLYPGANCDAGFGVSGNRLQIFSDNPNADVALGYDAAGVFNERFAVKPNGALAVVGNTGLPGQVLTSNGAGAAASWTSATGAAGQFNFVNNSGNSADLTNANNTFVDVPGLMANFVLPSAARVVFHYRVHIENRGCFGCSYRRTFIQLRQNVSGGSTVIATFPKYTNNNEFDVFTSGPVPVNLAAGTYSFKITLEGSIVGAATVYSSTAQLSWQIFAP